MTVGIVAFRIRTGPVRGISTMTPGLLAMPTVSKSSVRLPQTSSYYAAFPRRQFSTVLSTYNSTRYCLLQNKFAHHLTYEIL